VYIIEPLGPYNVLGLKIGALIWKSLTPTSVEVKIGQRVWCSFSVSRLSVFDAKSEEALL